VRFHLERPGHALERGVVEPEDEVGPVSPVFGPVTSVDAVDGFEFLEPLGVHDPLRPVGFESPAVERGL
jgi:hypothetical protein